MWVMGLLCKQIRICYKIVYKNVIKKVVSITLCLKESMIFLRKSKCNFIEQNCQN